MSESVDVDKQPKKPARRLTQVERKENAEKKLLAAAIQLIAKRGVDGVTLGEIGVEGGYSRGLPTHHFGSRSALLREVGKWISDTSMRDLHRRTAGFRGIDGLKRVVEYYFERDSVGKENSKTVMALLCDSLREDAVAADYTREYIAYWIKQIQQLFEEAVSLGQVSPKLDVRTQSALLLGTLRGTLLQYMVSPDHVDLKAASRALQANIEALRSPPHRAVSQHSARKTARLP
jgi:AcrR family transcriptional regulator